MSADLSPPDAISEASRLLQQNQPPKQVIEALQGVLPEHTQYAEAQFLRAIAAFRDKDPSRAVDLYLDAATRGERREAVWLGLAHACAGANMPAKALAVLVAVLASQQAGLVTQSAWRILQILGFGGPGNTPAKDKIFKQLVLPLLATLLRRRQMDDALALENLIYDAYVKATETETHFGACMERLSPLFTEAGHAWRADLEPLPAPPLMPPHKVGFFIHAASTLAHIEILLNTLKAYRRLDEQPFEPIVYCFARRDPRMETALAAAGVRLVLLSEEFPETRHSAWGRLLRLRELLSEQGVQELVWLSRVTVLPLAFAMRLAPVQVWWCMKYHNFSHPDIDGYLTTHLPDRFGMLSDRLWRSAPLGNAQWLAPEKAAVAARIRSEFGASVVLMTIARTEKMEEQTYLAAVAAILRAHPEAVFLWAGRAASPTVVEAFETAGVLHQTRFLGWVDTLLYAQVCDIFLDTFPVGCGLTILQAMAAGKAPVLYCSEITEHGFIMNVLKRGLEGDEGSPAEQAELRTIVGDRSDPLMRVAHSPEAYVANARRLIDDPAARAAAGEAARRFVEHYFSNPLAMSRSIAEHLEELIEEKRAEREAVTS